MKGFSTVLLAALFASAQVFAQTYTTQSQMKDADRAALKSAAEALATRVAADDRPGVRSSTIPQFQQDFTAMANEIAATAPALKGAQPEVDQLYLLDASTMAKTAAGANPDAQFFCNLNQTVNEVEFSIPQLPPARYAFAMCGVRGSEGG